MSTRWSNVSLALAALFVSGEAVSQQQPIPADIGVTMTATPSTGLRTGQVIDIALTAANYGPEPADNLALASSYFYHEFSITNIDTVACYQFGGSMSDGVHPVFDAFWIIAGVPGTGMQPLAVGETRTCRFQLVLMADAPQVTSFSFGVSTYYSDINLANNVATVYLQRATTAVPMLGWSSILLLVALVSLAGAVGAGGRARLSHIG